MHQSTMKTNGQRLQGACKTRWFSSEAAVRVAKSEILAIWSRAEAAVRNQNSATCIGLIRLVKAKNRARCALV